MSLPCEAIAGPMPTIEVSGVCPVTRVRPDGDVRSQGDDGAATMTIATATTGGPPE